MPVPEDRRLPTFHLLVVPGVTTDKWTRMWSERVPGVELRLIPVEAAQTAALLSTPVDTAQIDTAQIDTAQIDTAQIDTAQIDTAQINAVRVDAGLVRLPVDKDTLAAIPLYTEVTVVVVPRDHLLTAADEVTVADLADEILLEPLDTVLDWAGGSAVPADRPATTAAAVELVAAGAGVLVVPQSLARAYHRRDLTYLVVTDAPTSSVALAWPHDRHTDLVEEMIGIVRGRTANTTRGRPTPPAAPVTATGRSSDGRPRPASGRTGARRGGPKPPTPPRRRGR